mmetsp:Transcript_4398/g.9611  ORF Transcript_4398/g.9611 Transcript_4398/m.9611 type:complete len:223 (-) Transcript_4398:292-960(-)
MAPTYEATVPNRLVCRVSDACPTPALQPVLSPPSLRSTPLLALRCFSAATGARPSSRSGTDMIRRGCAAAARSAAVASSPVLPPCVEPFCTPGTPLATPLDTPLETPLGTCLHEPSLPTPASRSKSSSSGLAPAGSGSSHGGATAMGLLETEEAREGGSAAALRCTSAMSSPKPSTHRWNVLESEATRSCTLPSAVHRPNSKLSSYTVILRSDEIGMLDGPS